MTQWVRDTRDGNLLDILFIIVELAFNIVVVIVQVAWALVSALFTLLVMPLAKAIYKEMFLPFTDYVWEKIRQ